MFTALFTLWLSLFPERCPVHAADAMRFPPLTVCESAVEFLSPRVGWLAVQALEAPTHQRGLYGSWCYEERGALNRWIELRSAQQCVANGNDEQARRHLNELRFLIGDVAYLRGDMPPVVSPSRWQWRD